MQKSHEMRFQIATTCWLPATRISKLRLVRPRRRGNALGSRRSFSGAPASHAASASESPYDIASTIRGVTCWFALDVTVGPEYQGIRPLPQLWTPGTLGEVYDAYRTTWDLLADFRRSATGEDKARATKVMLDSAFRGIQRRWMEVQVVNSLKAAAVDPDTDLHLVVKLISRYRRLRWRGLSRNTAAALRTLDDTIRGWVGNESDHYRTKRDKLRGWLASETTLVVIEWLESYIEKLNYFIRDAEIREERRL
jgi:hypothetical protein